MQLTGPLIRVSLLLFVVSVVGLVGLNGSLDPSRVSTARAASLDVALTSNAQDTLQFQLNVSESCPQFLAPGDACYATVDVTNVDPDWTVELSQPSITDVSGSLNTCGGNGPNISVELQNINYSPDSNYELNPAAYLLQPNETVNFEVHFALADVGNECQGQTGRIEVAVQIGVSPSPTPTPTNTPTQTPTPSVTPVATDTPTPTSTPGLAVDINLGGPGDLDGPGLVSEISEIQVTPTLTSEILPTRLPVTGQGWEPVTSGGITLADVFFLGLGGVSIVLFILAFALRRKENAR